MKVIIQISVMLMLSFSALAQNSYRCYGEICVPEIGEGKRILTTSQSPRSISSAEIDPYSQAEIDLADYLSTPIYSIENYLPNFVVEKFNTRASFSGPNCYNTALIGSGFFDEDEIRYVSRDELKNYLKTFYRKVSSPQMGDIVIYDDRGSQGHAALYLFDNLIFQKKGFLNSYLYRVGKISSVSEVEPGEWTPSPFDGMGPPMDMGIENKKMGFYRLRNDVYLNYDNLSANENQILDLIDFIGEQLLNFAGKWKVGYEMGLISEHLIPDLKKLLNTYGDRSDPVIQIYKGMLTSFQDQIYQSIHETHFSSRYADERRINPQICYKNNSYLQKIIRSLLKFSGKSANAAAVNSVFSKLDSEDKVRCRISLVKMIVPESLR